jgi:hypothetical protein
MRVKLTSGPFELPSTQNILLHGVYLTCEISLSSYQINIFGSTQKHTYAMVIKSGVLQNFHQNLASGLSCQIISSSESPCTLTCKSRRADKSHAMIIAVHECARKTSLTLRRKGFIPSALCISQIAVREATAWEQKRTPRGYMEIAS